MPFSKMRCISGALKELKKTDDGSKVLTHCFWLPAHKILKIQKGIKKKKS